MTHRRSNSRRSLLPALAAVTLALSLGTAAWSGTNPSFPLSFSCEDFGGNCTRSIPELGAFPGGPINIALEVPNDACFNATSRVGVEIEIDHQWVGDLRVGLRHESSGTSAVVIDRSGAPELGQYGCPGIGVDVRIDDSGTTGDSVHETCELTIPSIVGTKTSAAFFTRLVLEPEIPPVFGECAFERFDGEVIDTGGSTLVGGACPSLANDGIQCDFRGRFNDQCGAEMTVRLTTGGNEVTLQILEQAPAHFVGTANARDSATLRLFEEIVTREDSGSVQLSGPGLEVFGGVACGGQWTLSVEDLAAPHSGRVLGWTLLLAGDPTVPPTNTATTTPTPTASNTTPPTPTNTGQPTATDTSEPAATPTATAPTFTPTAADSTETPDAATSTPTEPTAGATDTPSGATPTPGIPCIGDCDGSGDVSIAELIRGVNIALGEADLSLCEAFDRDGNGSVEISELIAAVNNALSGCP